MTVRWRGSTAAKLASSSLPLSYALVTKYRASRWRSFCGRIRHSSKETYREHSRVSGRALLTCVKSWREKLGGFRLHLPERSALTFPVRTSISSHSNALQHVRTLKRF